jgi:dephospho-CoA kinase
MIVLINRMSIILIRGYSQSGKDFVGKILCKKYGYQRFAFADPLKQLVVNKYQVSMQQLHSQQGKMEVCREDEQQRTYRQILIDEALLARSIDDNCFAKDCCKEIKKYDTKRVVITDWRYPNELEVLKEYFPDYEITPVHLVRISQSNSPVVDRSEYQLVDRRNDRLIINTMDERIYQEVDYLISSISYNYQIVK